MRSNSGVFVLAFSLVALGGCKSAPEAAKPASSAAVATVYPARPDVGPPAFTVFHQDNDTYTLVTKVDATDAEVEAIVWQLHDAAHDHSFDKLHLSQKFIDARAPKVWFHLYRGAKCAGEKLVKGDKYPCGAAYHGAGDYTLGSFKDPNYEEGVLLDADGKEVRLWDPDESHSAR